jgi:hypothetical protein
MPKFKHISTIAKTLPDPEAPGAQMKKNEKPESKNEYPRLYGKISII